MQAPQVKDPLKASQEKICLESYIPLKEARSRLSTGSDRLKCIISGDGRKRSEIPGQAYLPKASKVNLCVMCQFYLDQDVQAKKRIGEFFYCKQHIDMGNTIDRDITAAKAPASSGGGAGAGAGAGTGAKKKRK